MFLQLPGLRPPLKVAVLSQASSDKSVATGIVAAFVVFSDDEYDDEYISPTNDCHEGKTLYKTNPQLMVEPMVHRNILFSAQSDTSTLVIAFLHVIQFIDERRGATPVQIAPTFIEGIVLNFGGADIFCSASLIHEIFYGSKNVVKCYFEHHIHESLFVELPDATNPNTLQYQNMAGAISPAVARKLRKHNAWHCVTMSL